MATCPYCDFPGRAAVCSNCGRSLPRLMVDNVRDLAYAAPEGTSSISPSPFDTHATERALRKLVDDLLLGSLSEEAYYQRLDRMSEFIDKTLINQRRGLQQVRRILQEEHFFPLVEGVEFCFQAFGEAFDELAAFGGTRHSCHVEKAVKLAVQAMERLAIMDRETEELKAAS